MQEVGGTGSITAVQVKGPESDWEGMSNKWGAAWEIAQAPKYPLDIHLTNDQGQEVRCIGPSQCASAQRDTYMLLLYTKGSSVHGGSLQRGTQ